MALFAGLEEWAKKINSTNDTSIDSTNYSATTIIIDKLLN